MCGIAGKVGGADRDSGLTSVLDALERRGPDDHGRWKELDVSLGHRRLSIIGLAPSGRNPMFNEDGSLALVFNGEIFNYQELRDDLRDRGHRFSSDTDSEVLLHLYEDHGPKLLSMIEGMYAFAIWNRQRRELFAARDPFGEKPFYYGRPDKGGLVFASSATALVRSGLLPAGLDAEAVGRYLLFGGSIGSQTLLSHVHALPAGGNLRFRPDDDSLEITVNHGFPSLLDRAQSEPPLEWGDLVAAVRRRMIADVPTGVFLSGGIDSTVITAAARQVTTGDLKSFSIGYESPHLEFDETADALIAARHIGTDHHTDVITADDFARSLDQIVFASDLPSHDGVNTFFASRLASRNVKVTMTGIGGDELFGGYSTFRYERMAGTALVRHAITVGRLLAPVVEPIIAQAERSGRTAWPLLLVDQSARERQDPFYRWFQVRRFLAPADASALTQGRATRAAQLAGCWSRAREGLLADMDIPTPLAQSTRALECMGYMSPILLRDADAMSMYHGHELRAPFLDSALVRKVLGIKAEDLLRGGTTKAPLRSLIARHLPDRALEKRKQGFGLPMAAWLCHPRVRSAVQAEIADAGALATGVLDISRVKAIISSYYARSSGHRYRSAMRVWMLFTLLRWIRLLESPL